MITSAAIFLLFGNVFAQQNSIHYTQNISNWPYPIEPGISPIRIAVTVFLEEFVQPRVCTVSGLPKATKLEESRMNLSPTSRTVSSLSFSQPQPYHRPSLLVRPCSVSDAAACRHWQPASQSTSPASTSRTNLMEFTGSASQSKFESIYFLLLSAVSLRLLTIRMWIA